MNHSRTGLQFKMDRIELLLMSNILKNIKNKCKKYSVCNLFLSIVFLIGEFVLIYNAAHSVIFQLKK